MPPKPRSQTTRPRPPIHSPLEKHSGTLELESDIPSRAQQSSPEYDPMEEIREAEGIATNTTPRCKRTKTSTVRTEKREQAPNADPNKCLITNQPMTIELCYFVSRATDHETLTKMEYVWEEGYQQLNVDTKRNLLHLRADWHYLFNTSEWMLVPEAEVVKELSKIYLEDECITSDLTKLFAKETYRYYFVPAPTLKEPICRFPDTNNPQHQTHFPPFSNIGPLEGHIHPRFVVFNTGQKLLGFRVKDFSAMRSLLKKSVPSGDQFDVLDAIQRLYEAWTEVHVPADYCNLVGTSKRAHPPSAQHEPPPKRQGLIRSMTRSQRQDNPHAGRCLITNRPRPVELCHLVATATDHETLTKLEYVWEEGYLQLNIDSKRNLFHLRADWHRLFDTLEWVLIPEGTVIRELKEIYLEEKCETRDLAKLFVKKSYRYYFLPSPTLNEPICRFPDVNEENHKTVFPPFADLGFLESHIHPQFVIFNTGQKLLDLSADDSFEMISLLKQVVPREDHAFDMLYDIIRLYRAWTKANIPADYCNLIGTSKRARPLSERRQDDRFQHEYPKREQQRAVLPYLPPEDSEEDDASSVTDDTVVEDDSDWIEYIHKWQKESDGVAGKCQESGELHDSRDEQLTAYRDEHARTPPSPSVWDSWNPTWGSRSRHPSTSDRSRFSSNDWAVFKNDVYLTR